MTYYYAGIWNHRCSESHLESDDLEGSCCFVRCRIVKGSGSWSRDSRHRLEVETRCSEG